MDPPQRAIPDPLRRIPALQSGSRTISDASCNPEVKPNANVVIGITTFAENGLWPLPGEFRNRETGEIVSGFICPAPSLAPQIVDAGRAAWRPGGAAAALTAAAACRRASADHRPGEGEAEAGGEEATMAAKRIGGSGARGWGGS